MPNYIWAFLIALVAAVMLTPFVIRLAFRTGALDAPDARKVHKRPIPRIGGLAIYAAFMISMLLLLETSEIPEEMAQGVIGLFIGGSMIVALGLWDDYVSLPARVKLIGQILCAWAAVAFGVRIDFITSFSGGKIHRQQKTLFRTQRSHQVTDDCFSRHFSVADLYLLERQGYPDDGDLILYEKQYNGHFAAGTRPCRPETFLFTG